MKKLKPYQKVLYYHALQIFEGTLAAGEKLPPLRQISEKLAVDFTSLKIGLRQLKNMNLLYIKNGSIYVKDYQRCASIEFLEILFQCQAFWPDRNIIDQNIMNEIWAFWSRFISTVISMAAQKATMEDVKPLMDIFDAELSSIHETDKLIELEILLADHIVKTADNLMVTIWHNSTKQINHKLIAMYIQALTPETLIRYTEARKQMVSVFISGLPAVSNSTIENFRELINSIWQEHYSKQ